MALQKQIFELPMTGPLDESVRPETGDPAAFSEVLNFVQDKRGAYSKRRGSTVFTRQTMAGTNVESARKIAMMNERTPVVIDGSRLYAYTDEAVRWTDRDRVPEAEVTRFPGIQPGRQYYPLYEIAGYGDYRVVSYSSFDSSAPPGYLTAVVVDVTTGVTVLGPQDLDQSATQNFVKIWSFCIGATCCVVYDISDGNLYLRTLDLTSATTITAGWTAPVTLLTLRSAIDVVGSTSLFYVVSSNAAFTTIEVNSFLASGALNGTSAAVAAVGVATGAIAVRAGTDVWVAWATNASVDINVFALNPTLLTVTGTSLALIARPALPSGTTLTGIVATTSGKCIVATSVFNNTDSYVCIRGAQISAGAVATDGALRTHYRCAIVYRPYYYNSRAYMGVVATGITTFSTRPMSMFVVDITSADTTLRAISNPAPNLSGLAQFVPTFFAPRSVYQYDTKVDMVVPVQRSTSIVVASLDFVTLDYGATGRWQNATIADSLHMSSGVASVYDGSRVAEQNFLIPPEVGTIASGTAGSLTGTYLYSAIYEHVDAAGNLHWSEPAVSKSSGAVVAKRIDVPVATLPITSRMDTDDSTNPVRVVFLRSITLGSTLYRHSVTNNVTSAISVTLQDNTSDAVLTANPLAYTQPGQPGAALPRRAPPSLTCLIQHNDGLAALAEDGHTIWFSGAHIPGEGIWWNPLMIAVVEDESRLVGLASFDGRLYAFTRRSVWVIDGSGFTDNGAGGYSLPRRLAVEAGCIEPRSIVVCGVGALFLSDLGIMLLSRSGEVTWFGEIVRDTLADYPIITSAVCDSTRSEVRFSCVAGEDETGATGEGAWIKWDYSMNRWTVGRTYTQQIGDPEGFSYPTQSQAIGVVNDEQVILWCKPDGYVYKSNDADWLDQFSGSTGLPGIGVLQTNWVHLAGLQGFQRLWRVLILLRRYTDHQVNLTAWFDYDDSNSAYTETWSFTAAEIAAMPREQLELRIKKQRCQSIKIKLRMSDNGTTGTGQQAEVYGFRYEFGTLPKTTLSTAHR
jgi:hypothetical protein